MTVPMALCHTIWVTGYGLVGGQTSVREKGVTEHLD
jgi:hypothetical protein